MLKNIAKTLGLIVFLGAGHCLFASPDVTPNYPELSRLNQPVTFVCTEGDYSMVIELQPAIRQANLNFCGTTKDGNMQLAQTAQDLEKLSVLRRKIINANDRIQIDRFYFRETALGTIAAETFDYLGLLTDDPYKGTILINEYNKGFPMQWVVRNLADVKSLQTYFDSNRSHIKAMNSKPLLMLFVLNGEELTSDITSFLNDYFIILDSSDPKAAAFFEKSQKTLNSILKETKDADYVSELFGDIVIRGMMKQFEDFEIKKMSAEAAKWIAILFTVVIATELFKDLVYTPAYEKITGLSKA